MLFNSPEYMFFFLPVVVLGFWTVAHFASHKIAAAWLVIASLFFYGWWNPRFLPLLLASIVFNYGMGLLIEKARKKNFSGVVLFAAIATNLTLLGLFKYSDFFIGVVNNAASTSFDLPHYILPLGISFFTFTQIAFLVDVHRGIAKEYSPVHYFLFVTYFPHLIAGPILHHKEMMPQFAAVETYSPQARSVGLGLFLFGIGLFKKTVLADHVAPIATEYFLLADTGKSLGFMEAWMAALAYTLQLYFDFSGYVDMALGASKMLGIDLPINFNSPYKAVNMSDFWRRWHMTLGRFFRDYVYIPLGGNRKGLHRAQINIVTVMLLSGLWHGAGWTFIVWGAMHAGLTVTNNYWRAFREKVLHHDLEKSSLVGRIASILVTFICVVFCWVFFRAKTIDGALTVTQAMLALPDMETIKQYTVAHLGSLVHVCLLLLIVWLLPNTFTMTRGNGPFVWQPTTLWLAVGVIFMLIGSYVALYGVNTVNEFLYFNF